MSHLRAPIQLGRSRGATLGAASGFYCRRGEIAWVSLGGASCPQELQFLAARRCRSKVPGDRRGGFDPLGPTQHALHLRETCWERALDCLCSEHCLQISRAPRYCRGCPVKIRASLAAGIMRLILTDSWSYLMALWLGFSVTTVMGLRERSVARSRSSLGRGCR